MKPSPFRVLWFWPLISSHMLNLWLFLLCSAPMDCTLWVSSVSPCFNRCISRIACPHDANPPYCPKSLSPVETLHLTSHLHVMLHPAANIPSNNNNINRILSVIVATGVVIIASVTYLCLLRAWHCAKYLKCIK